MGSSPLYLTLMLGPLEAVPAPKPVMDALVSAEVHVSATENSGFELVFTLANSSPLQILFLLAQSAPVPFTRVILVANWGGLPQVLMDGIVNNTEVKPDAMSGSSQLVVKGEDLTALMRLIDFSGFPYPTLTPDDRVSAILAKYEMFGIGANVVPVVTPFSETPAERTRAHKGTDFDYIQELTKKAGYVFYITPGPVPGTSEAYWGPQIRIGVPQPALNVNMDTWTNVESLNFQYEPQNAVMPIVYIQDPNTNATIPVPIPGTNPLDPPLGAVVPTPQQIPYLKETAKLSTAEALMTGFAKASQTADIVTGDGTINVLRYGQILQARQLVGVRGAGLAFDGLYYVDTVRHSLKFGEYKQSFTLKRNALVSNLPAVPTMPF